MTRARDRVLTRLGPDHDVPATQADLSQAIEADPDYCLGFMMADSVFEGIARFGKPGDRERVEAAVRHAS